MHGSVYILDMTNTDRSETQDFIETLAACRSRVDDEPWTDAEKDACARRMTEAYFRGCMDRERIERRRMAMAA